MNNIQSIIIQPLLKLGDPVAAEAKEAEGSAGHQELAHLVQRIIEMSAQKSSYSVTRLSAEKSLFSLTIFCDMTAASLAKKRLTRFMLLNLFGAQSAPWVIQT